MARGTQRAASRPSAVEEVAADGVDTQDPPPAKKAPARKKAAPKRDKAVEVALVEEPPEEKFMLPLEPEREEAVEQVAAELPPDPFVEQELAQIDEPLTPEEEETLIAEFGEHYFDELTDEQIDEFLTAHGVNWGPEDDAKLAEFFAKTEPSGHEVFGERLGSAEFVGQYEDGSPEWHEARTKGIGGSDAASILGIGYTSAYVLWMQKKGFFGEDKVDKKMEEIFWWGHQHEPAIAARWLRDNPEYVAHEGGSWRKADAPWMLANPDRILVNGDGELEILEIKSSEQGTGWENDRCPAKYVVQLRHYMWVFGISVGHLCVKIGNSDFLSFRVPADVTQKIVKTAGGRVGPSEFVIDYGDGAYLQQAERNFLDLLEPPAMDGNKDIYEFVRAQNPSLNRGEEVELSVEIGTMLLESEELLKKAELRNQEARNHVMAHMGCAQYAVYNGDRVASRVAKGSAPPYLKVT